MSKAEKHEQFNPEEEGREEKIEISGEEFLGILNSEDFLRALKSAAQKTAKSGHEAGFRTKISRDKSYKISGVTEGENDRIQYEYQNDMDGYNREPSGSLIELHFHPNAEGAVSPSGADLEVLGESAFLAVGTVKKDGGVDVLLVRKKSFISDDEILENARIFSEDAPSPNISQEDVMRHLDDNGFENLIIHFEKDKRKLALDDQSKNTILGIKSIKSKISQ